MSSACLASNWCRVTATGAGEESLSILVSRCFTISSFASINTALGAAPAEAAGQRSADTGTGTAAHDLQARALAGAHFTIDGHGGLAG